MLSLSSHEPAEDYSERSGEAGRTTASRHPQSDETSADGEGASATEAAGAAPETAGQEATNCICKRPQGQHFQPAACPPASDLEVGHGLQSGVSEMSAPACVERVSVASLIRIFIVVVISHVWRLYRF